MLVSGNVTVLEVVLPIFQPANSYSTSPSVSNLSDGLTNVNVSVSNVYVKGLVVVPPFPKLYVILYSIGSQAAVIVESASRE